MGQDKVKLVLGSGLIMAADVIAEQDATIARLTTEQVDLRHRLQKVVLAYRAFGSGKDMEGMCLMAEAIEGCEDLCK